MLDSRTIEVVDEQMAAVFRAKTGAQRLQIANGMFSFARQLVRSSVRDLHPDWSDEQVQQETARRLLRGAI